MGKSKVAGLVASLRSAIAAEEKSKVAKRITAKPKVKKPGGGSAGKLPITGKPKPVAKAKTAAV